MIVIRTSEMTVILQKKLPPEMQVGTSLPGVAPCAPDDWLRVDEVYAQQMAYRAELIANRPNQVLRETRDAAEVEALSEVLTLLPHMGFDVGETAVCCPDGRKVTLDRAAPLHTLGHLIQQDICVMQKRGDEHVLTGAVLCFPANWRLRDKIGKPLSTIHKPVPEYDPNIARRVQRMFDGIKAGRPLWRFNHLHYASAELHTPGGKIETGPMPFIRAERQCLLRLPRTQAVIFAIHTLVVRR